MTKRKYFYASDGYKTDDLLKSAIDHLHAAYSLFQINPLYFDSAGYLSHLGLELILKSILLEKNECFPQTHDLNALYEEVKKSGFNLFKTKEEDMLEKIHQFYHLRYTNFITPIEIGDDDWTTIESVANSLLSSFPGEKIEELYATNEKCGRILMKKEINEST